MKRVSVTCGPSVTYSTGVGWTQHPRFWRLCHFCHLHQGVSPMTNNAIAAAPEAQPHMSELRRIHGGVRGP